MNKPEPLRHIYEWQSLKDWLKAEAPPTVVRETSRMVEKWEDPNGSLHHVHITDHEEGLCGDTLSPETREWLKSKIAPVFGLWVWW